MQCWPYVHILPPEVHDPGLVSSGILLDAHVDMLEQRLGQGGELRYQSLLTLTWLPPAAQGGKLEKTIKSEPVPASNDGPVKVLVADQFDELVIASGKSVLIEFYAPWCGHCQSLAPVYEQVRPQSPGLGSSGVYHRADATLGRHVLRLAWERRCWHV